MCYIEFDYVASWLLRMCARCLSLVVDRWRCDGDGVIIIVGHDDR